MSRLNGRKKIVAIGAACLLLATAGAYAYWTTSAGTGTGTASTESTALAPIGVVQTSTITGLYPGGAPVALAGTFDNPNPGPVQVGSLSVAFASTAAITGAAGTCTTADYKLDSAPASGTASTPINAEASPADTTTWGGLTIQMLDSGSNQDGCKGATVHLVYTSN